MKIPREIKYIVGIDEAGRGPLAGPVSIGLVLIHRENLGYLSPFRDSKILKEEIRNNHYREILKLNREGFLECSSSLVSEKIIDKKGIIFAIRMGISRTIRRFDLKPQETLILLDGSLKAPKKFTKQETISGGDRTIRIIGAASIVAKVRRDRKMIKLSDIYPEYQFHKHKGYGTKEHLKQIKKLGLSDLHRRSYTKNLEK